MAGASRGHQSKDTWQSNQEKQPALFWRKNHSSGQENGLSYRYRKVERNGEIDQQHEYLRRKTTRDLRTKRDRHTELESSHKRTRVSQSNVGDCSRLGKETMNFQMSSKMLLDARGNKVTSERSHFLDETDYQSALGLKIGITWSWGKEGNICTVINNSAII